MEKGNKEVKKSGNKVLCDRCKKYVKVEQKINCYICSQCRIVLGYGVHEK